jgi:hypothetical protein
MIGSTAEHGQHVGIIRTAFYLARIHCLFTMPHKHANHFVSLLEQEMSGYAAVHST